MKKRELTPTEKDMMFLFDNLILTAADSTCESEILFYKGKDQEYQINRDQWSDHGDVLLRSEIMRADYLVAELTSLLKKGWEIDQMNLDVIEDLNLNSRAKRDMIDDILDLINLYPSQFLDIEYQKIYDSFSASRVEDNRPVGKHNKNKRDRY